MVESGWKRAGFECCGGADVRVRDDGSRPPHRCCHSAGWALVTSCLSEKAMGVEAANAQRRTRGAGKVEQARSERLTVRFELVLGVVELDCWGN